ncbi:MAG: hypothetical protein AABX39_05150, partial [Nanoarchaeota archaeon]
GFVSWQNTGDDLTGEALWNKPYRPPPQPTCPRVSCPTQYEVELAAGRMVPVSGNTPGYITKPGLAEGDIINYVYYNGADKREVKIEVLVINPMKREVSVKLNGQQFIIPLEGAIRFKNGNVESLATVVDILQGATNFVQLAISDIFTLRYGIIRQVSASDIHLVFASPDRVFVSADSQIILSNMDFKKGFAQKISPRETTKAGNILSILGIKQI